MATRKKNEEESDVSLAAGLRDDEELEISNKQTIRKNRRAPVAKPEPEPLIVGDEDLGELVEGDDVFEEGSLGSLLGRSEDDELRATQCNIIVVRKPDSAGEKFVSPCISRMTFPPIRNIELTQAQTEIEELVRSHYGGGHYYLQIQIGRTMQTGWACDLADPPDAFAKASAAKFAADHPTPIVATVGEPKNAFEEKIAQMELEQKYDELRFGAERKRMVELEAEAKELRDKVADLERQNNMSDPMRFLTFAQATGNQSLVEKALDNLLDRGEDERPHWLVDLVKTGFEHKEEIAGLAQMVLAGIVGPPPQHQAGIEGILRQPPPTGAMQPSFPIPASTPEPPRSNFRRGRTTEKESDGSSDKSGVEAGDDKTDE